MVKTATIPPSSRAAVTQPESVTPSLAVLLLANTAAPRLEAALASVSWAPQILIGWTGGQPVPAATRQRWQTVYPQLTIHQLPGPIQNFAGARNQLQAQTEADWVLWLDSDEVLAPTSRAEIMEFVTRPLATTVAGVRLQRRDVFAGRELHWGEVRHVRLLRLYQRRLGSFIRPVHEVAIVDGPVINSQMTIHHYAHQSLAHFLTKISTYAQLEAELRWQRQQRATMAELIIWPLGKLAQNLLLRLAFLDGWPGLAYAVMMSLHSLLVRVYLRQKALPREHRV